MADLQTLESALRQADAAGDVESATVLANEIRKMRTPASVKGGEAINSIPRQLGLTARYGIEGVANAAQLVTEPIRAVTDRLLGATGKSMPLGALATRAADAIGLPSPQGANERVIGDATRMVAGAGGLAGAASLASNAPGMVGQAASLLSSNLPQQLTSAAGAGLAGGMSREAGGSPLMQGGAALLGGVAGGLVGQPAANTAARLEESGRNFLRTGSLSNQPAIEQQVNITLQRAGVDLSGIPAQAQAALRRDVANALNTGAEVDPAAIRRLADFRTVGASPTRGMVSQNPVQITQEQNLAKIGANSSDEGLQGLALLQNRNNATFIDNLNRLGAGRGDPQQAGNAVVGSIVGRQNTLRNNEQALWDAARSSPGYRQPIEANVVSQINGALGEEGLMPFMNPTISRYMEAFMTGQQPFTPQAYRNLQSMLSNEISKGGNEGAAARLARNVLERSELRPITNPRGIDYGNALVTQPVANAMQAADAAPSQAIDAVNRARAATRAAYAFEDSNPLVRSVLSDGSSSDPMRIAQRFVIGGTPNEARMVVEQVGPNGVAPLRDAILSHLKEKAINGAADEFGKFSQSNYNKALQQIGQQKLGLFFSPEEVAQLQALGRVASAAQVQPVGSAVNNSNSGALAVAKTLDALRSVGRYMPILGPWISDMNVAIRSKQAQKVIPSLLAPQPTPPLANTLLLPAAAAGGTAAGLLSAP